jgi:hypothetical protein
MTEGPSIQYRPPHKGAAGFGFSDAGERIAVALPECNEPPEVELLGRLKEAGAIFPDDAVALEIIREAGLTQSRGDDHQTILKFITLLTHDTVLNAGQAVFIMAYGLGLLDCKTQKQLADRMGITQARVSQLIRLIAKHP